MINTIVNDFIFRHRRSFILLTGLLNLLILWYNFVNYRKEDIMKIYYVFHSCFVVETESSFLLFDYYKTKKDKNQDFDFNELLTTILKSNKNLYVFSSHSHQDHFNSQILSWVIEKENIYYILSNDIKLYDSIKNIYTVTQNENFALNNLNISTFGSTDAGVSFLINVDGTNIFHAGDLNWWKWPDDTPEEEKEMEDAFKAVIKDVVKTNAMIDIAFFPVDPRLEDNYLCGGQYFIEKLNPKIFIPMHFWGSFKTTADFKYSQENTETEILKISHSNQTLM